MVSSLSVAAALPGGSGNLLQTDGASARGTRAELARHSAGRRQASGTGGRSRGEDRPRAQATVPPGCTGAAPTSEAGSPGGKHTGPPHMCDAVSEERLISPNLSPLTRKMGPGANLKK